MVLVADNENMSFSILCGPPLDSSKNRNPNGSSPMFFLAFWKIEIEMGIWLENWFLYDFMIFLGDIVVVHKIDQIFLSC